MSRESLVVGLTKPQRRHLLELLGDGSRVLYWRPANGGEERCAATLKQKGLLSGSYLTYSDGYRLSADGLRIARALRDGIDA